MGISYELAKELKEAGIQQVWTRGRWFYLLDGSKVLFETVQFAQEEDGKVISYQERLVAIPTLSELIEACGDGFTRFERLSHNQWQCEMLDDWYLTPEEAVARLYLALSPSQK